MRPFAVPVTGGLFSGQFNDSEVTVGPTVSASIASGGVVNTSSNIEVSAAGFPEGDAITKGIGGGFINLGGSKSHTTIAPDVTAAIAAPTVHAGGNVTVTATAAPQSGTVPDYRILSTNTSNDPSNTPATAPDGAPLYKVRSNFKEVVKCHPYTP